MGSNPDFGVDFIKMIQKIVFWISVIFLAFIPGGIYMSFVLLILYYGSQYLKKIVSEFSNQNVEFYFKKEADTIADPISPDEVEEQMKQYSDDTLDEMK